MVLEDLAVEQMLEIIVMPLVDLAVEEAVEQLEQLMEGMVVLEL